MPYLLQRRYVGRFLDKNINFFTFHSFHAALSSTRSSMLKDTVSRAVVQLNHITVVR